MSARALVGVISDSARGFVGLVVLLFVCNCAGPTFDRDYSTDPEVVPVATGGGPAGDGDTVISWSLTCPPSGSQGDFPTLCVGMERIGRIQGDGFCTDALAPDGTRTIDVSLIATGSGGERISVSITRSGRGSSFVGVQDGYFLSAQEVDEEPLPLPPRGTPVIFGVEAAVGPTDIVAVAPDGMAQGMIAMQVSASVEVEGCQLTSL